MKKKSNFEKKMKKKGKLEKNTKKKHWITIVIHGDLGVREQ